MTDDLKYLGETQKRVRWVACVLTAISPGLGYMYVGQLLKGVTLNLLFLLMLESFVILFSVLKFFPLLPAFVLALSWVIFTLFSIAGVLREIPKTEAYVLKGYNHWMVYMVVLLATFVIPVFATTKFVSKYLVSFERIDGGSMYPSFKPGDIALVDTSGYLASSPDRGELVLVRDPETGDPHLLRVVAVAHDIMRVEGAQVFVNESPLHRTELDKDSPKAEIGDLLAYVETNNGQHYVISVSPTAFIANNLSNTQLKEDEFFLMADNRSQVPTASGDTGKIRDSRNFGPVSRDDILGKPLYIAWSSDAHGDTRFARIGLRTH